MKQILSAVSMLSLLGGPVLAGSGHRGPNPYDKDFHRQVVQQEIRRAMRSSGEARDADKDEDAHNKAGSFFEGTWEPKSAAPDPVEPGDYGDKPTGNLHNAGPTDKDKKEVASPEVKEEDKEKGFFAKAGDKIGGFFSSAWGLVKNNLGITGGAVAGGLLGLAVGGPFGLVLGAFIGGFGGWWVGEGLGI